MRPEEADRPSVLVVLVARDGAPWLKRCLASLGRQTHPRLGVLAMDNASVDGTTEILVQALGAARVQRLERNVGYPGAVARALGSDLATKADYVLLMHDDVVLAPTAVERMVDAVERVEGGGVVGAKVLDWEEHRVLREVGLSTDRFGYPYSPLEEGEIDQGQYDSPREVLYVTGTAMLVSRDAWMRAGRPDERLGPAHADLDFCWRVRLAGFRIVVEPSAVVLHRAAGDRGERPWGPVTRGRFLDERAGLAGLLKNYRGLTLLWVLPLYLVQGLGKVGLFLATRRFATAVQVAAAWGWNLVNLPGTIRRRVRAQAVRSVRDRDVWRYMAPAAARLRRWAQQVASVWTPADATPYEFGGDEAPPPLPLGRRLLAFAGSHPVALAWLVASLLSLVAFRHVVFADRLEGGALPAFPDRAVDLLREFAAGWRSRAFGGAGGASPALVPLGLGSVVTFGDPRLLVKILVALSPALAAVSCYRAVLRRTEDRGASVLAAACYALSATTMWAVSEGRLPSLVFLVALPWLAGRVFDAFEERPAEGAFRWMVGTAMGVGLAASFFPAVWLAAAVATVGCLVVPTRRALRGLGLVLGAWLGGAVLVFPFAAELVRSGGAATIDAAGTASAASVLRLSPGSAPGNWFAAGFLPLAAAVGLSLADDRRWAWRSAVLAAASIPLAWLAAAGHLPHELANPMAYLGLAAFVTSMMVGLALRTVLQGVAGHAFGYRQVGFGLLATIIAVGVLFQSASAVRAGWGVGEEREPPGWPLVASADLGIRFRVLWLGDPEGEAFPPPGGAPDGVVAAGGASVRYGVTGRAGRSVLDIGLPASGPGFERLETAVRAILGHRVRHGGALLAPLGIRYVVAGDGDLPAATARRLADQLDLDLLQSGQPGGLVIYRNARAFPVAAALAGDDVVQAARSRDLLAPARSVPSEVTSLSRSPGRTVYGGSIALSEPGMIGVAADYDARWRVEVDGTVVDRAPFVSFGWALGFDVPAGPHAVRVGFGGQWVRTLELFALAALWSAAVWVTRRSGR